MRTLQAQSSLFALVLLVAAALAACGPVSGGENFVGTHELWVEIVDPIEPEICVEAGVTRTFKARGGANGLWRYWWSVDGARQEIENDDEFEWTFRAPGKVLIGVEVESEQGGKVSTSVVVDVKAILGSDSIVLNELLRVRSLALTPAGFPGGEFIVTHSHGATLVDAETGAQFHQFEDGSEADHAVGIQHATDRGDVNSIVYAGRGFKMSSTNPETNQFGGIFSPFQSGQISMVEPMSEDPNTAILVDIDRNVVQWTTFYNPEPDQYAGWAVMGAEVSAAAFGGRQLGLAAMQQPGSGLFAVIDESPSSIWFLDSPANAKPPRQIGIGGDIPTQFRLGNSVGAVLNRGSGDVTLFGFDASYNFTEVVRVLVGIEPIAMDLRNNDEGGVDLAIVSSEEHTLTFLSVRGDLSVGGRWTHDLSPVANHPVDVVWDPIAPRLMHVYVLSGDEEHFGQITPWREQ